MQQNSAPGRTARLSCTTDRTSMRESPGLRTVLARALLQHARAVETPPGQRGGRAAARGLLIRSVTCRRKATGRRRAHRRASVPGRRVRARLRHGVGVRGCARRPAAAAACVLGGDRRVRRSAPLRYCARCRARVGGRRALPRRTASCGVVGRRRRTCVSANCITSANTGAAAAPPNCTGGRFVEHDDRRELRVVGGRVPDERRHRAVSSSRRRPPCSRFRSCPRSCSRESPRTRRCPTSRRRRASASSVARSASDTTRVPGALRGRRAIALRVDRRVEEVRRAGHAAVGDRHVRVEHLHAGDRDAVADRRRGEPGGVVLVGSRAADRRPARGSRRRRRTQPERAQRVGELAGSASVARSRSCRCSTTGAGCRVAVHCDVAVHSRRR